MRISMIILLASLTAHFNASAETITLSNGGKQNQTTGDNLDKVRDIQRTCSVSEIPGLDMTVKTSAPHLEINALSKSLGVIDHNNPDDHRNCFENDEKVIISFSKDVQLTGINFNHFDPEESFHITAAGQSQNISYENLVNKVSDIYECSITVPAQTEITLSAANDGSSIGIDSIDITVTN